MGNKILVTGASGNIGSALVAILTAAAANFEIMRSTRGAGSSDVRTRYASFDDPAALATAFGGIDTLFVLLPLVPNKLELARNIAAAVKAAVIKHLVRSSAAGADGRSPFALLRLQGTIDGTLAAMGIPATFIRPSSFMQNLTGYLAAQIRAGELYAPHGDGAQSLIDVRDIAEAAAAVLNHPQCPRRQGLHSDRAVSVYHRSDCGNDFCRHRQASQVCRCP
jgi:uncharacterized protein YbjT (DUF2867 family)